MLELVEIAWFGLEWLETYDLGPCMNHPEVTHICNVFVCPQIYMKKLEWIRTNLELLWMIKVYLQWAIRRVIQVSQKSYVGHWIENFYEYEQFDAPPSALLLCEYSKTCNTIEFLSFSTLNSEDWTLPISFHISCLIATLQLKWASNIATLAHSSPRWGKMWSFHYSPNGCRSLVGIDAPRRITQQQRHRLPVFHMHLQLHLHYLPLPRCHPRIVYRQKIKAIWNICPPPPPP